MNFLCSVFNPHPDPRLWSVKLLVKCVGLVWYQALVLVFKGHTKSHIVLDFQICAFLQGFLLKTCFNTHSWTTFCSALLDTSRWFFTSWTRLPITNHWLLNSVNVEVSDGRFLILYGFNGNYVWNQGLINYSLPQGAQEPLVSCFRVWRALVRKWSLLLDWSPCVCCILDDAGTILHTGMHSSFRSLELQHESLHKGLVLLFTEMRKLYIPNSTLTNWIYHSSEIQL